MLNRILKKEPQWTILEVLKWTTEYFSVNGIDSPRLTAEILLSEVLGIERIGLYVRFDQPLSEDERTRFKALVKRRLLREPVAYILGRKDFWKIELDLTPDVLIPRPETEILVERAIEAVDEMMSENRKTPFRAIDMGTGSGAIAISLAHCRPGLLYYASDLSYAALRVAVHNAALNKVKDRISFFASNWFESIARSCSFDMILSNPPYISSAEVTKLAPEILNHEPLMALDGDVDGLRDIFRLIEEAPAFLAPGGFLMMEIGCDQKAAVEQKVEKQPEYAEVSFRKDYGGHHRVAVIKKNDLSH